MPTINFVDIRCLQIAHQYMFSMRKSKAPHNSVQVQHLYESYFVLLKRYLISEVCFWFSIKTQMKKGEGQCWGTCPPPPQLSNVGGHKWVCAPQPTFGQNICSHFTILFANTLWLASLANFSLLIYWKEKETHILNFLTSDLYWEHYFS